MERLRTIEVKVGDSLVIGGGHGIVVQTMCNTHTSDVPATVAQCLELAAAGAQMIRVTVPGLQDVPALKEIRRQLNEKGCTVPLVADIHFSSDTAIACASVVEKVRINPGNFHPDHETARRKFAEFLEACREHGTAVRVGLNHGSLGKYITELYGNTPFAMAKAAMEWLQMCIDARFFNVVVSLKASNTVVMVQAYRELVKMMKESGTIFPLHLGVTEAGNGESGRIKSCVGIASLLREGIGDTIRVSLTADPVKEVTAGIAILKAAGLRKGGVKFVSCPTCGRTEIDLIGLATEVEKRVAGVNRDITVAVMGCVVNGPGEAREADYGIAGGVDKGLIFKKGEVVGTYPYDRLLDVLMDMIENDSEI